MPFGSDTECCAITSTMLNVIAIVIFLECLWRSCMHKLIEVSINSVWRCDKERWWLERKVLMVSGDGWGSP